VRTGRRTAKLCQMRSYSPAAADLLVEDRVGGAEHGEALGGDLAEAAHGEAGAGEGVAVEHLVRHAEGDAGGADLVLEELAERLDEGEVHAFGEAADVVVALDDRARALEGDALDHVGVERALHQEAGALDLLGLLLEDLDEDAADDLALLLRVGDPAQLAEEAGAGVDVDEAQGEVIAEHAHHRLRFAGAEQAVVDEDAGEALVERLLAKDGGDRRVDAAGEAQDGVVAGAHAGAHRGDRVIDEGRRRPRGGEAGDVEEEGLQDLLAARRVSDLGWNWMP